MIDTIPVRSFEAGVQEDFLSLKKKVHTVTEMFLRGETHPSLRGAGRVLKRCSSRNSEANSSIIHLGILNLS